MQDKSSHRSLYILVLVAIVLGAALGALSPTLAVSLKPLSDGFIRLIKALLAPIVFCTVVTGLAGMEGAKKLGKVSGLALLYFEVVSTVALVLGLVLVLVVKPGVGMHVDARSLDAQALSAYVAPAKSPGITGFLLDLVPSSFFGALVQGEVLQVLFVSVLFGLALRRLGFEHARPIVALVDALSRVMFAVVSLVMIAAPLAAGAAMAFTVGSQGLGALLPLGRLMGTFYASCLGFVLLVLGAIARLHGFSILKLLRYLRDELMLVLATSSSEAALPGVLAKLERLGAEKSVVGLVVPAGYSFNLDGTSLYLTMATGFVAQATDTEVSPTQYLTLLAVLLVASKGAAGVTGSGFIVLASTLSIVPTIPLAGLTLLLGVDRLMSEARALTNLVGNCVATLVVARWTKALDPVVLQRELATPPRGSIDATIEATTDTARTSEQAPSSP